MTQKLRTSTIVGIKDFAVLAASHAAEMKAWRAHMARVRDDERNEVPIEERHVAYPQPRAHPLVHQAVNENDEVDYQIVDDGPTADERLAIRKLELLADVTRAEQAAIAAAIPTGKRRLYAIRESEILAEEASASAKMEPTMFAKLTGQAAKNPVQGRTPEVARFMADQETRRSRIAQIERAAAQAMHDIEDLTAETIGSWKLPTF